MEANDTISTSRKTLTIITKVSYETKIASTPSARKALNDGTVMLTFEGSDDTVNQIAVKISDEMIAKSPAEREVSVMADEKGIFYDQRPNKPKWNCGISSLQNIEEP
jgi:hypothetical protein